MRVVLDTDVLVAALRSDQGASRRLLVAALNGSLTVLASVPLLIEYEAVLLRPLQLASMGLDARAAGAILDAYASVAHPVTLHYLWRPTLRDPADDMVLETALNGRAEALITFNVRDFLPEAARFDVAVMTPAQFVQDMEA